MANLRTGKVVHYYDKIGVAVIDLNKKLTVGERIKFVRQGKELFQQEVVSMQYEHKKINSAKKGESVGLQVEQKVKKGTEVYQVD